MRAVSFITAIVLSLICSKAAHSACRPHDDDCIIRQIYLEDKGWAEGKCTTSHFVWVKGRQMNIGLNSRCEVENVVFPTYPEYPIGMKCEEDNNHVFELRTAVRSPDSKEFSPASIFRVTFEDDLPIHVLHMDWELWSKDKFGKLIDVDLVEWKKQWLPLPDKPESSEERALRLQAGYNLAKIDVGLAGNIEQFVCRADTDKRVAYQRLLMSNLRIIGQQFTGRVYRQSERSR